ncbi:hypothetical protein TNCV_3575041 [Trichonephila clavipes]|nr:hypothetical protein TNCV_3575041 [Trichonephila clavipes]
MCQIESETIETYVTHLKTLAFTCEFAEQENELIRDRVVVGIDPPIGQHGFFRPTREASKTDHTEFFLRPGTHQK